MAASIRSLRNGITPVDDASRDDLAVGDVVTVGALVPATSYSWVLSFVPAGSTAAFSGSATAVSPGTFTVDVPGPYLVRLTTDVGLPTESTQYVRLRVLTPDLGLRLVAAGERRDSSGVIPVDASPEGWANDQNFNLGTLEAAVVSLGDGAFQARFVPIGAGTYAGSYTGSVTVPNLAVVMRCAVRVVVGIDAGITLEVGTDQAGQAARFAAAGDSNPQLPGLYLTTPYVTVKAGGGAGSDQRLVVTMSAVPTVGTIVVLVEYVVPQTW